MLKLISAAALALVALPVAAQECPITTNSNSILRQAPGAEYAQVTIIPAHTAVPVSVCFDRGAFCAVRWGDKAGFVSGDLLATGSTTTLRMLEEERWARMDSDQPGGPAAYDRCNIVVWGDSLSHGTFGPDLARLLGRDVSMQGIPGEDGRAIGARMLADVRYDGRIVVLWDRHYTNESVDQYMADFAPLVEKARNNAAAFVVISDIADLDGTKNAIAAADAATTDAINAALRAAYPANFLDVTALLAAPSTRTDGLHLTPQGYALVADAIAAYMRQRNW